MTTELAQQKANLCALRIDWVVKNKRNPSYQESYQT